MTEPVVYRGFLMAWFGLSVVVFAYLLHKPAPYGRHGRAGWGPKIRNKTGWVLMELPAVVVFALLFLIGNRPINPVAIAFLCLWEFHYLYRTFVFSALLRGKTQVPLAIVGSGFLFNVINGYINGRYLFHFSSPYALSWFGDPRFVLGAVLFFTGFSIHFGSDRILRNLRAPGESSFKIPHGALYRWISCPNYLGELVMWLGWTVATWSLPALAFFVWSAANLAPRALAHHRWYRQTFADYPQDRKALIPYLI